MSVEMAKALHDAVRIRCTPDKREASILNDREVWDALLKAATVISREQAAPSVLHAYEPHEKYPHCARCGYARSERLMHSDPCPTVTEAKR
jgi:hypothetical protein